MEPCKRPNRSDAHLSSEEEAKLESQTREHFESIAPKRHTKPQRSDPSPEYTDALSGSNADSNSIPELAEFQRLETDTDKLGYAAGSQVPEEFVETEYYKDLNCVDKQHHTTGTGFIRMTEKGNGEGYALASDSAIGCHASCKGNPATNDWIPAAADKVTLNSGKPSRGNSN